jgi:hypothetical protein
MQPSVCGRGDSVPVIVADLLHNGLGWGQVRLRIAQCATEHAGMACRCDACCCRALGTAAGAGNHLTSHSCTTLQACAAQGGV